MSFEEFIKDLKLDVLKAMLDLYTWEQDNNLGRHEDKINSLVHIIESKKEEI